MYTNVFETYSQEFLEWIVSFAPKLLLAVLIVIVGMWVVRRLLIVFARLLDRAGVGVELSGFFMSMTSIALKFVVILVVAGTIGFQVSSVLGVLAWIVFAIGLALQGFLGNFAAGITIIFFQTLSDWRLGADIRYVWQSRDYSNVQYNLGDTGRKIPNNSKWPGNG